jgi:predicted amidohydrolase YtcJ
MVIKNNTASPPAETIIRCAKIATLDPENTALPAIAIRDGKVQTTGSDAEIEKYRGPQTKVIDAPGRTVVPGLYDSHLHLIRGGLNFNMELRWDGVPSLADAMRMLKEQTRRTPPPQWVRVVGGWTEQQFAERRAPTLDEINEAAPDTPVFVLHLYDRALLNRGTAYRWLHEEYAKSSGRRDSTR